MIENKNCLYLYKLDNYDFVYLVKNICYWNSNAVNNLVTVMGE